MMSLHRLILPRVLLVWLGLSLIAGGLTYWLEMRKIDQAVVALAAAAVTRHGAERGGTTDLARHAEDFLHEGFVAVEILAPGGTPLARSFQPGFEGVAATLMDADTPRSDRPRYRTIHRNGATLVRVVLPLSATDRQPTGHFEGLYRVEPATLAGLRGDLWRTLLAVLTAVLATTVVLYPLIVALNRNLFRASREVLRGNLEMAAVLGAAIAKRDSDTNAHNYRVTLYGCLLAEAMGLHGEALRALMLGAFLHDVGKIGIPDTILLKPAALTDEERSIMRSHVSLGVDIIASSAWLRAAREVIQNHHEWFDGSGYPRGLAGEAIPLTARIFAVVDVFDALTSQRPYKTPWSCDAALATLEHDAGSHFDPALVAAFAPIARQVQPVVAQADEAAIAERLATHIDALLLADGNRPLRGLLRRRFGNLGG